MLSARCKTAVKEILKNHDLHFIIVDLGEVEIMEDISTEEREELRTALLDSGFELMDDKKAILIERIKNTIIDMVHHTDEGLKVNFSNFLINQFLMLELNLKLGFSSSWSRNMNVFWLTLRSADLLLRRLHFDAGKL